MNTYEIVDYFGVLPTAFCEDIHASVSVYICDAIDEVLSSLIFCACTLAYMLSAALAWVV